VPGALLERAVKIERLIGPPLPAQQSDTEHDDDTDPHDGGDDQENEQRATDLIGLEPLWIESRLLAGACGERQRCK
jgi:hypothetical protein